MAKKAKVAEIDVTKHTLVPKHTKLTDSEKERVLKKYQVTVAQLPKILIIDPAIKHLEPQIGDVIKIIRESKTAGEAIYYRGVING